MKLTIDRNIWLRGEGFEASRLLREEDQKQCCVGIYLEACGVPRELLKNKKAAEELAFLPTECAWSALDAWAGPLYRTNDKIDASEEWREAEIKRLFAKQGVEVEFQ